MRTPSVRVCRPTPSAWRNHRRRGIDGRDLADHDVAGRAVDGQKSPTLTISPLMLIWPFISSMAMASQPTMQGLPQPRATRRVAGLAAGGRENALGQVHAGDVLRTGLFPHEKNRLVGMLLVERDGGLGREDHLAAGRAGLAAMPRATTAPLALGSSCGRSRWLRLSGLTRLSAVACR